MVRTDSTSTSTIARPVNLDPRGSGDASAGTEDAVPERRRWREPPGRAPGRPVGARRGWTIGAASGLVAGEGAGSGVPGGVAQLLLDPEELVVLRHALGAGRRTGLDLTAVRGDRQVGDRGVLGLPGAMAHHAPVAVAVGQVD